MTSVTGDRLVGAPPALRPPWGDRPDPSDAGLQGVLQRPLHVHDWQQSQERAVLRQVHRLLPDADDGQTGELCKLALSRFKIKIFQTAL